MKKKMEIILIKKISLLLLLLSAALFSTSLAGRLCKSEESKKVSTTDDEGFTLGAVNLATCHTKNRSNPLANESWCSIIQKFESPPQRKLTHGDENKNITKFQEMKSWGQLRNERILKVKTNDYGKYDPAPALVKPPFKLIPN